MSTKKEVGKLPKTRYSDSELQEFKELINKKLTDTQQEFTFSKDLTKADDGSGHKVNDGAATLQKEETSYITGRQQKYIQDLRGALVRIENKTYGICVTTGKLIPKERLIAVPHTTKCMEAKLKESGEQPVLRNAS